MTGATGGPAFGQALGVRVRGVVLWGGTVRERGHGLEELVDVMQVRNQLEPEGDFGGAVVISDARLQADVEVQLLFGRVLRPGHLFEAVGFGVDELGILRDRLIGVTGKLETIDWLVTIRLIGIHVNNCWRVDKLYFILYFGPLFVNQVGA